MTQCEIAPPHRFTAVPVHSESYHDGMTESAPENRYELDEFILPQATGALRIVLVTCGLVNVGLAYIGWLLPGIPMTPFVLTASYCFARSSPRLQRWLLRSPFFGQLIIDWHRHRGMRFRLKLQAIAMLTLACTFSIVYAPIGPWVKLAIAISGAIGWIVILFVVPTIREKAVSRESAAP